MADLSGTAKRTVMGLDYGQVTVGVAVSDALGLTAVGLETIWRNSENKLRRTLARIKELAEEHQVGLIVVGLPVHMDGSVGERAEYALEFGKKVAQRTSLPVVWQDERLTTYEAREILLQEGIDPKDHKKHLDRIAAALILQDYMDSH